MVKCDVIRLHAWQVASLSEHQVHQNQNRHLWNPAKLWRQPDTPSSAGLQVIRGGADRRGAEVYFGLLTSRSWVQAAPGTGFGRLVFLRCFSSLFHHFLISVRKWAVRCHLVFWQWNCSHAKASLFQLRLRSRLSPGVGVFSCSCNDCWDPAACFWWFKGL